MSKDDKLGEQEVDDESGVLPKQDSDKLFHKIPELDLNKSFTKSDKESEQSSQDGKAKPKN